MSVVSQPVWGGGQISARLVGNLDRQAQVVPGGLRRHGAVGAEDESLRRRSDRRIHRRPDLLRRPLADDPQALQPAHEWPPEQARHLLGGNLFARQIQAGVDHVAGVVPEFRQISVGRVVVAHVQDVERAGAIDLAHDRQIVRANAGLEQAWVGQPRGFAALGGVVEAVQSRLDRRAHKLKLTLGHPADGDAVGVGVFLDEAGRCFCPDHVVDEHVGRVEGQEHRRLLLGCVDQPFDHVEHRRIMVELEEGQLGPIGRFLDFGLVREEQLELDLHEIHAGVAEVLQVLVHRRLSQVIGGVEVEEERRRDACRLGFRVDDAEEQVAFVHTGSCPGVLRRSVEPNQARSKSIVSPAWVWVDTMEYITNRPARSKSTLKRVQPTRGFHGKLRCGHRNSVMKPFFPLVVDF